MSRGVHKLTQTAFRIPEGLLSWLREQAEREGATMAGIMVRALEAERTRCRTENRRPAT